MAIKKTQERIYTGTILFTDMKDFTFRSSVLNKKNLDTLIQNQNTMILPPVKDNNGEVVKTIGDSYMVLFENVSDALNCAIQIQKWASHYNAEKKILEKIEFRIAISTWTLSEVEGIKGSDYFWNTVNIASRLLNQTAAGRILVTDGTFQEAKDGFTLAHLWDMAFKWTLEKEPIYELLSDPKDIRDHTNGTLSKDAFRTEIQEKIHDAPKKIEDIIFKISSVTAIVSIQPVPFLDIYSSVPLHMYMVKSIGNEYGINLSMTDIKELLGTIWVGLWGAYALGQWFLGLSKIGLPVVGWYIAVPFSFWFTYALWKTISTYFYYRSQNTTITEADISEIFKNSKKDAIKKWKKEKKKILEIAKKEKDVILSKIQSFHKHSA